MAHLGVAEPILLNFKSVELSALVQVVAEVTGRNFVIDPNVKAEVTAISATPLEPDELYQVFLSILDLHGYAAIPGPNVTKIVPAEAAEYGNALLAETLGGVRDETLVSQVVGLQHISAHQALDAIKPILSRAGKVTELPDPRKLIVADQAGRLRQVGRLLAVVDRPNTDAVERVALQYASATDVAGAVTALDGTGSAEAQGLAARVVVDERTNSLFLRGTPQEQARIRALVLQLDTPVEAAGNVQVIYLHHASAEELVPILSNVLVKNGPPGISKERPVGVADAVIEAEPATNALIVRADPDVMESVRALVRRLDIRRVEVLIEAIIAEVSVDTTRELGVQWLFASGRNGRGGAGATSFGPPGSNIVDLANAVGGNIPDLNPGLNLAIGRIKGGRVDLGALLRALAADAHTNVLSTPSLVTLDNSRAEIVVGQNVPFVTGQYTSTGSAGDALTPFQTIQRQDVGLTLAVRPQVNQGDTVKLLIEQETSSISPTSSGAADIVTNKRSIKTTVLADDGQLIVLGGLIDESVTETIERVPFLGYLPVIGRAFRFSSAQRNKRNLMVFLRPKVLYEAKDSLVVAGSKYSEIRARQQEYRDRGAELVKPGEAPLLPPLEDTTRPPKAAPETVDPLDSSADGARHDHDHPRQSAPDPALPLPAP